MQLINKSSQLVDISELFFSLEGEAVHSGLPTVYIRFARCNKKCPLWNNPDELKTDGYAQLGFDPKNYTDLVSLPTIARGCDSQYAVNPAFAHMWKKYDATELLTAVLDLLPGKSWSHPVTGLPVILSLTGGEPTLRMKFIVDELLANPLMKGCKHILFETNCSVPLRIEQVDAMYDWAADNQCKITWTNSPKLSNSGETWDSSIVPRVALAQRGSDPVAFERFGEQLFKFVVGSITQWDFLACADVISSTVVDIQLAMEEYYRVGIPRDVSVSLMPEACTTEQQLQVATELADFCKENGYRFSIRLQNVLWKNLPGT
jgi:7-carboxy-7-deazaguanine synthase